jgi:hypothetical protein
MSARSQVERSADAELLPIQFPLPLGELKPLFWGKHRPLVDPAGPPWYRDYLRTLGGFDLPAPGPVRPEYIVLMGLHRLRSASLAELSAQLPAGAEYGNLRLLLGDLFLAGLVNFDRINRIYGLTRQGRRYLRAVYGLSPSSLSRVRELKTGWAKHRRLARLRPPEALKRAGFTPLLYWAFPRLGVGFSFPDGFLVAGDETGSEWLFLVEVEWARPHPETLKDRIRRRLSELERLRLGRPGALVYLVSPARAEAYRRFLDRLGCGRRVRVLSH